MDKEYMTGIREVDYKRTNNPVEYIQMKTEVIQGIFIP